MVSRSNCGLRYCDQNDVTSNNQMLFRWDMVALGTEAVFVRNVAHSYACSFWAYVGVEAFLHYDRLPAVTGVQKRSLFTDRCAVPV